MAGWSNHTGLAIGLPIDNIDTDQLIPARFMSASRAEGYGDYLLHDMRRNQDGSLDESFPLNTNVKTSVVIAGRNFGSGSSREAAVYALADAGVRAVIAPSFGDIFSANSVNNGLLPATVSEKIYEQIIHIIGANAVELTINLETATVSLEGVEFAFFIDPSWQMKLIKGWDDIDLTLEHAAEITGFRQNRIQTAEWAWPSLVD